MLTSIWTLVLVPTVLFSIIIPADSPIEAGKDDLSASSLVTEVDDRATLLGSDLYSTPPYWGI